MAQILNGNQVKLNNGQVVQAQTGGWYDGQQFWNGTLSAPGFINSQSNQQGAGQAVSNEVIAQTNPNNVAYVQKQQQTYKPSDNSQTIPSGGTPAVSGDTSSGIGFTAPQTINLPQLYEQLYQGSGIRDLEAKLNSQIQSTNDQVAKIKDNPYLSEATMSGRIAKIEAKAASDQKALQDQIATQKADIETKLNLQTKQFDINSQAAQRAFQQYTSLLESGALNNASGEDIANITRATGLSSSMIQSAINAQKQKNVTTSTIQYDDGKNQGFVVINDKTGEIINRQVIGASTKKTTGSGGLTADQKNQAAKTQIIQEFQKDAQAGYTLSQMFQLYAGLIDANQIYTLYNTYSKYGSDKDKNTNATKGTGYLSEYGVTLFK